MRPIEERYISLLTDFGFKRIFGTPPNKELREYEDIRKAYRDLKNSLDTAVRQGHAKGLEEGLEQGRAKGLEEGLEQGEAKGRAEEKKEVAKKMKAMGMSIEAISQVSGLSAEQIGRL